MDNLNSVAVMDNVALNIPTVYLDMCFQFLGIFHCMVEFLGHIVLMLSHFLKWLDCFPRVHGLTTIKDEGKIPSVLIKGQRK